MENMEILDGFMRKRRSEAKHELLKVCAEMLHGSGFISEYADDNPKTTPKCILKQAEQQREILRKLSIRIKSAADKLYVD